MKKIFQFIRGVIILIGWTYVFTYLADVLFVLIWNFDFMSTASWQIVWQYWDNGGIIKSTLDILLFAAIIALPFLWYIGLRRVLKINFISIITSPIKLICDILNHSYNNNKRIVIRYTKSSEQKIEEIKNELASLRPKKAVSSQGIRSNIKEKISNDL